MGMGGRNLREEMKKGYDIGFRLPRLDGHELGRWQAKMENIWQRSRWHSGDGEGIVVSRRRIISGAWWRRSVAYCFGRRRRIEAPEVLERITREGVPTDTDRTRF